MPRFSGINSGPGAHAPRLRTGAKRTPEQPNLRLATVGKPKSRPNQIGDERSLIYRRGGAKAIRKIISLPSCFDKKDQPIIRDYIAIFSPQSLASDSAAGLLNRKGDLRE